MMEKLSLLLTGSFLGIVDGIFNPCALAVFFFLMAYLTAIASRRKCLLIGIAYTTSIFLVYSLFMFGLFNFFSYLEFLPGLKFLLAIIILIIAIIELKDFFAYGKFFSLQIPKSTKPIIEKLVKLSTIPSAFLLGILVSFVEIPCAGGFPLAYLTILSEKSLNSTLFYIIWYNFFFTLPLLILTLAFHFGLAKVEKAEKLRQKTKKYMRLISGIILLILALLMLLEKI
ncbi:MAG: hypothetical protein RMJ17_03830 [Candidatus Aenigmarchaeota archaeon]|nr:hypothetical protein [Candidatus Aenigmarchaeota archaeon]MDW8149692.1 hypothetical protein [Candidatus Aenigmarchaeota archaeon]